MDQTKIKQALTTTWIGNQVVFYPVVSSTNELLKQMADHGFPRGTLLIADYQHKGKGRQGRSWQAAPRSSLLFSILFQPNWSVENIHWLTMIAGIAITTTINQLTNLDTKLKWPNDIIVVDRSRQRKLGGILTEVLHNGPNQYQAILGIGINVNIPLIKLPKSKTRATSLLVETGQVISRLDLLAKILEQLEIQYHLVESGHSPQPRWESLLATVGQFVEIEPINETGKICGIVVGTNSMGHLIVRDEFDRTHAVVAGDVTLVS